MSFQIGLIEHGKNTRGNLFNLVRFEAHVHDRGRWLRTGEEHEFPEIRVAREQDTRIGHRKREHLAIGCAGRKLVDRANDIVTGRSQKHC